MKQNWKAYRQKVVELREIFRTKNEGTETEVEVVIPEDDQELPYVLIRFSVEDHVYERKIELFEHYLKKDISELVKLIEHYIQEFEMEIEQSEYGGG